MSKTNCAFWSLNGRFLGVVVSAALILLPAGCGSLPRLRSPFGSTASRGNRTAAKPDDNPFLDKSENREFDSSGDKAIVHDPETRRKIDALVNDLPRAEQQDMREYLDKVPSNQIDTVLRGMRSRRMLANAKSATEDDRSFADNSDWQRGNVDGRSFDDPYRRRRGFRSEIDVSPTGHRRNSDDRSRSDRESERRYSDRDRRSDYRGTGYDEDRPSRGDQDSSGLGRTLLDNRLVRSITGRTNPDSRDGRPLERGSTGRDATDGSNFNTVGERSDSPAEPLSGEWNDTLKRLIAITDARASKLGTPTEKNELEYIRNHVYLRMLYLMAGKQEHAVAHIPRISPADQEFWQHTLWGMTDYFREDVLSSRGNRATQTVSHFRTAVQKLREQADLEVRNLVFCRKISSFGNYETVPMKDLKFEFRAGESVLIYAEIDNFKSELTEDDKYRTRLKSTIEIYRDVPAGAGDPISFDFAPTKDTCRTQRRDYFHSYIIKLPEKLALGDYKLKLTVQDEVAGKMDTETVRFRIN